MKKFSIFICVILVLGISCSGLGISTPQPVTDTSITPDELPTAQPGSTAVLNDEIQDFEEKIGITVVADHFSVQVPFGLYASVDENGVTVTSEQDDLFMRFSTDPNANDKALDVLLDGYFEAFERRAVVFSREPVDEILLNDLAGIRVDFSGTVRIVPMEGSAIAVSTDKGFVFIGFGLSGVREDENTWETSALPNFEQIIASVTFLDDDAECPVSTDDTYGYTPENPIKVGGGDFDGPSRERAYLDHLLDVEGDSISYNRTGSTMEGDVILDIYEVSASDEEVILYVDEYSYATLLAPVGFTCNGDFPLSEPQ